MNMKPLGDVIHWQGVSYHQCDISVLPDQIMLPCQYLEVVAVWMEKKKIGFDLIIVRQVAVGFSLPPISSPVSGSEDFLLLVPREAGRPAVRANV